MQREKPYLPLTCQEPCRDLGVPERNLNTGAAWLSSARVVRCWVKSRNEATLVINCHHLVGHFNETAGDKPEEGGDDVKSSWPLWVGASHVIQWSVQRVANREVEPIPENRS